MPEQLFKGQIEADRWVCEMLHYKREGFFIDAGAFNGVDISNTYYLEKELGWNGICIEAGEENYQELIKNRGCLCIKKALWTFDGIVRFNQNWTVGRVGTGIEIESICFKTLLRDVPPIIDYISLDVEGDELEILMTFPWNYRVRLWTIEHNSLHKQEIRDLMLSKGYLMIEKPFEDWWYDNELTN